MNDPDDVDVLGLEPDALDGHTIAELADYLDAGMVPADPSIDDSPACQNALAALARVRTLSLGALDDEAAAEEPPDERWVQSLMANISLEARAGRSIPLTPAAPTEQAVLTEGSVRALVRRAGDGIDGILVQVTASIRYGQSIPQAVERVRAAVTDELRRHTDINLAAVDVTVRDVRPPNPGTSHD